MGLPVYIVWEDSRKYRAGYIPTVFEDPFVFRDFILQFSIRKSVENRVLEFREFNLYVASIWFKILYSLYAIRRHKFLRSHNRDTIGEISILDGSEWTNQMTK